MRSFHIRIGLYSVLPFLRRSIEPGWVGVSFEDTRLRMVRVLRAAGARPAVQWIWQGEPVETARQLSAARQRHRLDRQQCVALLTRGQYQISTLDAPDVPRPEWRDAVRWQLRDMLEFSADHAAIDVLEIPGDTAVRRHPQVLVVAAPREAVLAMAFAAQEVGLDWAAIDVAETALRNVSALTEPPQRAQALLHFSEHHGTLVITHGGELLMTRQIDVQAAHFASADFGQREAALDRAGLELQRTLDNFERLASHVSLARLLICPGPGTAALIEHARALIYVPVLPLDLSEALDLDAVPELRQPEQQTPWLVALGAALRE